MKTPVLNKPSTVFRSAISRGLAGDGESASPVDRTGGQFGAGLIRGFSVIAKGEALGHDLWIDDEFLSQVEKAVLSAKGGTKARFTHPGMSGDGMGKMTARVFGASTKGDKVFADAHMLKSAHKTPDGDLAGYVMDLAEEDAEAFGASISFMHDYPAEKKFMLDHGAKIVTDEDGYSYWDLTDYKSPDPKNLKNLPHARLKSLRAVDFVDSPAANPDGLFHAGPFELLENGESLLDFVFGVTSEVPADASFGVDLTRMKGFAARWAADRGFSINKESEMSVAAPVSPAAPNTDAGKPAELTSTQPPPAATPQAPVTPAPSAPAPEALAAKDGVVAPAAAAPAVAPATNPPAAANLSQPAAPVAPAATPAPAPVDPAAELRAGLQKFTDTFGVENGVKWFQAGMSFESAKDEHIKVLTAANNDKAAKLAAATTGLGEDAALSGTSNNSESKPNRLELTCGTNLAKVATAMEAQIARLQPSKN